MNSTIYSYSPFSIKRFALVLLLLSTLVMVGYSQKKKGFKKGGIVTLNDSLSVYGQSDIFHFPNINQLAFYYSSAKLKELQQLDNAQEEAKMYVALKKYIKSFGIENFSRSTSLLWRLAKLSEKYGPRGEAILLYKLVLKHHKQGIDINDLYKRYYAIETERKENYVPLDVYYKLVDFRKEIDTLRPPRSVLVRMDDGINSLKEDYGPAIGNVDNLLMYTSKRNQHPNRPYDEDLFYTQKIDGQWTAGMPFKTINTSYNEGSACLSLDGKQLYFSRCNAPGSLGHCDIYVAQLSADSTWADIKNLGANINSVGWDSHPALSHSGDTLFFASNRTGGFGLSDIYYSVKNPQGNWQKAINAGPIINTIQSEVSPFFHHRHNVLYFSSDGHPLNFGGFDIYKSKKIAGNWIEPKNIGPLVNDKGDEYYFTIDSDSHHLYYAKSTGEEIKNLDLYSFPVPMEAQPNDNALLKGSLRDSAGHPMKGIVSIIDLDIGVEVSPQFLRSDGTFDFSLINHRKYLLLIQGDAYFSIEEIFFLDGNKEINRIAEPIDRKIAFRSLEFERGKAIILPSMHTDLSKLGTFLIDHPSTQLTISGHTDSFGNKSANVKLSQDRADAIKQYLIATFKIPTNRISAIGYGDSKPIITKEENENHKQLNRRVEFTIAKKK